MKEISRRDFLRWVSIAGGGTLLAGCSLLPKPTPTRTPEPTKTPTPEPTKTPTPEPPKLLEKIETGIPGLSVERYEAKFQNITSEVPESYRKALIEWLAQPYKTITDWIVKPEYDPKDPLTTFNPFGPKHDEQQCGLSYVGLGRIRPNHDAEYFYFDSSQNRFYTNLFVYGAMGCFGVMTDDDKKILNWETGKEYRLVGGGIPTRGRGTGTTLLSCDGKILYDVFTIPTDAPMISYDFKTKQALIIADVPRSTKTLIKDSQGETIPAQLSDDGNKLLLHFIDHTDPRRGLYLIDLNNWRVQFHLAKFANPGSSTDWSGTFLNEDGSLLYVRWDSILYNTVTGEKTVVRWPTFLSSDNDTASRNLHYIARLLGMFSATQWVDGQFGIMAYTPEGFFMINAPGWSFGPEKVDNDGTIYTGCGDVFKFEGGTYKLVKMGPDTEAKAKEDGKPIEVRVEKYSRE